jgi:hypothetical protein
LALIAASFGRAALEFTAYIRAGKSSRFVVTDLENKTSSGWLVLGDSFAGTKLTAFDPKREVLTVKTGNTSAELPLKSSHVAEAEGERDLVAFRAFFDGDRIITAKEVEDRFGPPTAIGPLMLADNGRDVVHDRSNWNYELGNGESISVAVDKGKAIALYHFMPSKQRDGSDVETIRKMKPEDRPAEPSGASSAKEGEKPKGP